MNKKIRVLALFMVCLFTLMFFIVGCEPEAEAPVDEPPTETEAPGDTDDDGDDDETGIGQQGVDRENKIINIVMPSNEDGSCAYYHELMEESLKSIGYTVNMEKREPQAQPRNQADLETGAVTTLWAVESEERNEEFASPDAYLTNSLIGKRILLINAGNQSAFDGISSLDDFRDSGLVGAFGSGWFDVNVWNENDLPCEEIDGEWRVIYDMLDAGDRGIDYFSRGLNEIIPEAAEHPGLEIEQNLVLEYDRDFKFYLSEAGAPMKDVIEEALNNAKETGLMDELIMKYWGDDFEALDYDNRIIINLITP